MSRIGVIGYGYWGPNVARNLAAVPGMKLAALAELDEGRRELFARRHPGVKTVEAYQDLLEDPSIDAVAVITPAVTHHHIVTAALRAGKHVWVEKPLAESAELAESLVEEARAAGRVLFVDHTFVYTAAVRKMREIVQSGRLGKLRYYDSMRANLGHFRPDVNVLWDLAAHDLSIMDYALGQHPVAVSATAMAHVRGMPEDVGYLTCFYRDDLIAHIDVSWVSPIKVRRTFVGGDEQMLSYDDNEPEEKIRVYDRGALLDDAGGDAMRVKGYRHADTWVPALDGAEALTTAGLAFARSIQTGEGPVTDGAFGRRIVRALSAAAESVKKRGAYVEIGAA